MINYTALKNWHFDPINQTYGRDETILYALGLGIGQNPLSSHQLRYVFESGLRALPTMSLTFGFPGLFLSHPNSGVDYSQVVHGEQHCEMLRPLPTHGEVSCINRVLDVVDKGFGKAALVVVSRMITDKASGDLIARQTSVVMARGAGGFGGPPQTHIPPLGVIPDNTPNSIFDWATTPGQALIYRLMGDKNPLHADPAVAKSAGFDRPILHGLATYGIAGYAAIETFCDGDPTRLKGLSARFSAPVYPGETLRFEFWSSSDTKAVFRASALERGIIVLNGGRIEYGS